MRNYKRFNPKGAQFKIAATSERRGQVNFIEQDLVLYDRQDQYSKPQFIVDTFGPQWIMAWGNFNPDIIFLKSGLNEIKLNGPHTIFIPSWSFTYWQIARGHFQWQALVAHAKLPIRFDRPLVFAGTPITLPKNPTEVVSYIDALTPIYQLENQLYNSKTSARIKNYIDQNYREKIEINKIAEEFKISRVVMSRYFTKAYGISPVQYRQRIRLFDAMSMINSGESIADAIFSSGFSNISEFNRQFKNYLTLSPKSYAPRFQRNYNDTDTTFT